MKRFNRCLLMLMLVPLSWVTPCQAHPDLLNQIEHQSTLIEANPDDVNALLKRGDLYRRHREFERSAADFRRAREIAPPHGLLNWYEGLLAFDTFDFERANRLLSQYLQTKPLQAAAWYWRGKARVGMAQYSAAADDFSRAIETNARPSPILYRAKVLALLASGWNQTDRAVATVTEGLSHFPREINLLGLAVDLALVASDTDSAVRHFLRLDTRLLELPQWQFRQGTWHCIAGNTEKAREAFETLLSPGGEGLTSRTGTWSAPRGLDEQLQANPEPARCVSVMREYLLAQQP